MKILTVVGTRPEGIKLAPLVDLMRKDERIETIFCSTRQHQTMLDIVLNFFEVKPDMEVDCIPRAPHLNTLFSNVVREFDQVLEKEQPDWVLVQGDTSTCAAAALTAFHRRIKIGHVEAGLRTYNKDKPFPEESNRRIVGAVADLHFAPTQRAADCLIAEGIRKDTVLITGNTVVDALFMAADKLKLSPPPIAERMQSLVGNKDVLLVTAHRRESFGEGFVRICKALKSIAERYTDTLEIVYPVHLNPNVDGPVREMLKGVDNIHLIEPLDYPDFVWMMQRSKLIVTDSGGVQEEAPSLGKPVVVMRSETERIEGVDAGTAVLAGTDVDVVVGHVVRLLDSDEDYAAMAECKNPYGDGTASQQILDALMR